MNELICSNCQGTSIVGKFTGTALAAVTGVRSDGSPYFYGMQQSDDWQTDGKLYCNSCDTEWIPIVEEQEEPV